jgi:hypothetical protein
MRVQDGSNNDGEEKLNQQQTGAPGLLNEPPNDLGGIGFCVRNQITHASGCKVLPDVNDLPAEWQSRNPRRRGRHDQRLHALRPIDDPVCVDENGSQRQSEGDDQEQEQE